MPNCINVHIGLFYFMLGNINPKYRSNLHVIQLVAAVETPILQKHHGSIHKILEPFMSDIKALETVSIHACIFVCTLMHVY